MGRYFVEFAYDGTDYHGWQIQPNGNSVQEELQKALSMILRMEIGVVGAGRTDTGVHARKREHDRRNRDIRGAALPVLPRAADVSAAGSGLLLLYAAIRRRHVRRRPLPGDSHILAHRLRLHDAQDAVLLARGMGVLQQAQQRVLDEVKPLLPRNGGRMPLPRGDVPGLLQDAGTDHARLHIPCDSTLQVALPLQVVHHLF